MAHVSDEELGGSYDRATFLAQRREMVQLWANLLDELAAGREPVLADEVLHLAPKGGGRPKVPSLVSLVNSPTSSEVTLGT